MEPFFSLELELEEQEPHDADSNAGRAAPLAAFDRSFSDLARYQKDLKHCDTPLHKILQLCCPTSDACGQLNRHLQELTPRCMDGGHVDVQRVAGELQALGFVCQVWEEGRAYRDARSSLRNLRHDFIVCLGSCSGGVTSGFPAPLIVEPRFKQQFQTAYSTDEFETLVKAIPSTFVGPLSKLRVIVSLVAAEMSRAFRVRGIDLPPWRSHQALLSLWRPERLEQLAAGAPTQPPGQRQAPAAANGAQQGSSAARAHPGRSSARAHPGSNSAPVSPTAAGAQATPFAALAVSPFAAAAASAEGGGANGASAGGGVMAGGGANGITAGGCANGTMAAAGAAVGSADSGANGSDTAHQQADKPGSSRAPQVQAHSEAMPVPQRRGAKPLSMLAAALHRTQLRGRYEDEGEEGASPGDTADQFWSTGVPMRRQG